MNDRVEIAAFAVLLAACGYRTGSPARAGAFEVRAGVADAPDAAALLAMEEGARLEIAKLGGAVSCDSSPCSSIALDLFAIEERGDGVEASADPSAPNGERPRARGVRVVLSGRARMKTSIGEERATEVRYASEVVAAETSTGDSIARSPSAPSTGTLRRDAVTTIAARRLGAALVDELLGVPIPEEP